MTRTRESAKKAGSDFERHVADYLARTLGDDRIDRRVKRGVKDRGDIGGVRTPLGDRVVVECKDAATMKLSEWVREADVERANDDAAVGVVAHKRRGYGPANMGGTYVTLTLEGLAVLLGGITDHGNGSAT